VVWSRSTACSCQGRCESTGGRERAAAPQFRIADASPMPASLVTAWWPRLALTPKGSSQPRPLPGAWIQVLARRALEDGQQEQLDRCKVELQALELGSVADQAGRQA